MKIRSACRLGEQRQFSERVRGRRALLGVFIGVLSMTASAICVNAAPSDVTSLGHGRHRPHRISAESIIGSYALRPPRGYTLRQTPGAVFVYQWTGPQYSTGVAPSIIVRGSSVVADAQSGVGQAQQIVNAIRQKRAWAHWKQSGAETKMLGRVRCLQIRWSGTDRGVPFVGSVFAPVDGGRSITISVEDLAGNPRTWAVLERSLHTLRRTDLP